MPLIPKKYKNISLYQRRGPVPGDGLGPVHQAVNQELSIAPLVGVWANLLARLWAGAGWGVGSFSLQPPVPAAADFLFGSFSFGGAV